MVAFATEYAPTNEAPDEQNRAREIFLAVEVRAGENGVRSRDPRREKVAFSYETASGPTNFLNRDPINELGSQSVRDVKKEGDFDEELNLYAFVGNDPVNAVDYLGLQVVPPSDLCCGCTVSFNCVVTADANVRLGRRECSWACTIIQNTASGACETVPRRVGIGPRRMGFRASCNDKVVDTLWDTCDPRTWVITAPENLRTVGSE